MSSAPTWFVPVLMMVMVALAGAAIPPVLEDHVEPGFCSADCPVQHPGHGAATPPPPIPTAPRRSPVVVADAGPRCPRRRRCRGLVRRPSRSALRLTRLDPRSSRRPEPAPSCPLHEAENAMRSYRRWTLVLLLSCLGPATPVRAQDADTLRRELEALRGQLAAITQSYEQRLKQLGDRIEQLEGARSGRRRRAGPGADAVAAPRPPPRSASWRRRASRSRWPSRAARSCSTSA